MGDTTGEANLRGISVQRFVTGFADEDTVLKKFTRVLRTKTREFRWFQKTAGYLKPVSTSGITGNLGSNTSAKALMPVANQSWTRNTSYVRKYSLTSELIENEDIEDNDVDIFGTHIRDLLIGVASEVDTRIYNVGTENLSPVNINTAAATGTGWDDTTNGNPIKDLLTGMRKIRQNRYEPLGGILYINPIEHENLLNYIISVKGSSIPQFSSQKVVDGQVMEIAGLRVVVSENATTDYAWIFLPNKTVTWYWFKQLTSTVIDVPGIGKKIRVWEEGEAVLSHPKSSHLITDTVT